MNTLSKDQLQRYSRNIVIPEISEEGQKKLLDAKVLMAGAGGLGSAVGFYLAAAGIGTICIVDSDEIETSNLQRQILHNTKKLGIPKVESAKEVLEALNPDVKVMPIKQRITKDNIFDLIEDYDIVADCSDNFPTRFLINDACVVKNKFLVSGAASRFEGNVTTIIPRKGHCYRCLFEEIPPAGAMPSPEQTGVMSSIPGVIGTIQATEIIKVILGRGDILKNRILIYDGLKAGFRNVDVPRNPDCSICSDSANLD